MTEPTEPTSTVGDAEQPTVAVPGDAAVDATVDDAPPETVEVEVEPEEDINSKKVTLADLCAKGTALYAHKKYEEATECFAKAAELQAEINGEMSPENSEILFLYGRSLFKVGQSKSDVLGGKAPAEKKPPKPLGKTAKKAEAVQTETPAERITEEGVAIIANQAEGAKSEETVEGKKPLFQFTGDENFDDSDDEEVRHPQSPFVFVCTNANLPFSSFRPRKAMLKEKRRKKTI
jgi:HAT1-interacting factor 1